MSADDRRSCTRPAVGEREIDLALAAISASLDRRLTKHGPGAYAGQHEILGVIAEEYDELKDAIRANSDADTAAELIDIAVGCVFGVASLLTLGRIPDEANEAIEP